MTLRVLVHDDFVSDIAGNVDWVRIHRDETWVEALRVGVNDAMELLADFPAAGVLREQDGGTELRSLLLRRLPFVVWYVQDLRKKDPRLVLLRLMHARQHAPFRVPVTRPNRTKR